MRPSSPSTSATATVPLRQAQSLLDRLPVEILRQVLINLHPNDLPNLAAANRHLRQIITCIDYALAIYQLRSLLDESHPRKLKKLHVDHPILLAHTAIVIARFGYDYARGVFKWPVNKPWAYDSNEKLRLHRVEAMRTIVQSGYWPSSESDEELNQALDAAVDLKSLDLYSDIREQFPERFPDGRTNPAFRKFIFESARVGFFEPLTLMPANHPILSEKVLSVFPGAETPPETLMTLAIKFGRLESVKLLYKLGAPVNDSAQQSPLHFAIGDPEFLPDVDIVKFLLEHGADTEARHDGCTALIAEAKKARQGTILEGAHMQTLELLIAYGADLDARDAAGRTALYHAAMNGQSKFVQLLIDAGADVNAADWHGHTPLNPYQEIDTSDYTGVLEGADPVSTSRILEAHGAAETPSFRLSYLPLYNIVQSNDCELVQSLLEAGVSVHAPNHISMPPLHFALERGRAQAASILLAAGADPNARCWYKNTALHILAQGRVNRTEAEDLLALMLERGVDVNARGAYGFTALHYAMQYSKEMLRLLLRTKGVNLNVVDNQGRTWFELAEVEDGVGEGAISLEWLLANVPDVCEQMLAYHDAERDRSIVFKWPKRKAGAYDPKEELRLRQVTALRAIFQRGYWPSPNNDEELTQALQVTFDLRSLDLFSYLRRRFREQFPDNRSTPPYRKFIFQSARAGFFEPLTLLPANHPILFEKAISVRSGEPPDTLMTLAINFGRLESVKLLLNLGAPINDVEVKSPLHCAIGSLRGDIKIEMLKFLLEHSADIEACHKSCTALLAEAKNGRERTALELEMDHMQTLKLLIASGADIEARDQYDRTALYHSAMNGRSKCVQLLIDAGAYVNAADWLGYTPLNPYQHFDPGPIREPEGADHAGTSRILKAHGAVERGTRSHSPAPLYDAVESNDCELVRSLLEAGASLHEPDRLPSLHYALRHGSAHAAAILLAAGADPNLRSCDIDTALHFLAQSDVMATEAEELLVRMLELGVDLNARGNYGFTALHYAVQNSEDMLLLLLDTEGINLYVGDNYGTTWFELAEKLDKRGRGEISMDWLWETVPEVCEQISDLDQAHSKMGPSPPAPSATAVAASFQPRPTLNGLPVEVLREVVFHLHPNDLLTLAAVNRHLRQLIRLHIRIDTRLAKHHIVAILYGTLFDAREQESPDDELKKVQFDHPMLLAHMAVVIDRYGYDSAKKVFKWPNRKPGAYGSKEELRLSRVEAMRIIVQSGYWPETDDEVTEAFEAAVDLRSLDLFCDICEQFPERFSDKRSASTAAYRKFIFKSARFGFSELLGTLPANDTILLSFEPVPSLVFRTRETIPETLMSLAVKAGSLESVKVLHKLGAPVNDDELQSPLHCAIAGFFGDIKVEIVKFLLEHGADTEARLEGCTALIAEAKKGLGSTALFPAEFYERDRGHIQTLELLIASGANIEARDERGRTALYHAAMNGRSKCVQLLIDAGADVNAADWYGHTPLNPYQEFAARLSRRTPSYADPGGTSRILETHGAIDEGPRLSLPPLYGAVESDNCELMRSLLEAGASLHASNYMSSPPLHFALEKGKAQAAAILLAAGADPNARSWDKKTALHWLVQGRVNGSEAENLLARMMEREVDLNARGKDGLTALHLAVYNSKEMLLLLLRTEDMNLYVADNYGKTWFEVAEMEDRDATISVDWLEENVPDVCEKMRAYRDDPERDQSIIFRSGPKGRKGT
ncbi:hypothetical protein HDU96_002179 [Phlyctochytrium bullatum]|nr:hypothetical protein HDU96_002179 [Phlyctochytrium bullatum]